MSITRNGVVLPSWASVVFADELRRMAELAHPEDGMKPPYPFDVRWDDVEYYCVCAVGSHWLSFRVVMLDETVTDAVRFVHEDVGSTDDISEARLLMHGHVKWDGCMNVTIEDSETEQVALHFCGRRSATAVGVVLNRLYDLAAEHVECWAVDDEKPAWERP